MTSDQQTEIDPAAAAAYGITDPASATSKDIRDQVLNLEHLVARTRRVRRTVRLCLRGDLEDEFSTLMAELAELVDEEGNVLADGGTEVALGEQARAIEINERLPQLRREMAEDTYTVTFEAMPDDVFEAFEEANRDKNGNAKNKDDYYNRLLVATAVEPTITMGQAQQLKATLNHSQFQALVNAAYGACVTGGIDVPKLPSFLADPKPQA